MRVLLIGAPGAGKGTQAVRVAAHFGLTHISSGDLLRHHMAEGTATGRAVRGYVESGDLVPDAIILDMLRKPVVTATALGGYVLDGFPRTVEQAETAYTIARELGVAVQAAVHVEVPTDDLVRRLLARGRGADDTEEVIAHRLEVYRDKTLPMLDYYAERETLITVNGSRPVGEVTWSILVQLETPSPAPRDGPPQEIDYRTPATARGAGSHHLSTSGDARRRRHVERCLPFGSISRPLLNPVAQPS